MKRLFLLLLCLTACGIALHAHVINYELEEMQGHQVILNYIKTGYEHIIPLGIDHILFILCVFFLNTDVKQIVLQASMFTIAHTLTLGLAMYGVIHPPSRIIEPLIALSIVFLALENIFFKKVKPWRLAMVFIFGLIHGMGFAGALAELGLPSYAFATALISFNVGVELGQLTIILLMYLLVAWPFSRKVYYRKAIVLPSSIVIGAIAVFWTLERIYVSF